MKASLVVIYIIVVKNIFFTLQKQSSEGANNSLLKYMQNQQQEIQRSLLDLSYALIAESLQTLGGKIA